MNYYISIVPTFNIALILAASCYVVLKSGEISFGQQAFFGIGAYAGGLASALGGWPISVAFATAMLTAAFVAWVISKSLCRTFGFRFTLMTLVFGEFTKEILAKIFWTKDGQDVGPQGALGFSGIEYYHEHNISLTSQAVIASTVAALCLFAIVIAEQSPAGRRVRVVASDPLLAASIGINPLGVRTQAFVFAGAIAGLGGALFAHQSTYIEPANFSLMFGVHAVAYTLIGGLSSVLGPVIGTLLDIAFLESLRIVGSYRMVVFGTLIVLVLILCPGGVLGLIDKRAR